MWCVVNCIIFSINCESMLAISWLEWSVNIMKFPILNFTWVWQQDWILGIEFLYISEAPIFQRLYCFSRTQALCCLWLHTWRALSFQLLLDFWCLPFVLTPMNFPLFNGLLSTFQSPFCWINIDWSNNMMFYLLLALISKCCYNLSVYIHSFTCSYTLKSIY